MSALENPGGSHGRAAVRVLALGSPHGDDQASWYVARLLVEDGIAGAEVTTLANPLQILDELEGCQHLVVIDACRGNAAPGTIVRLEWPDSQLVGGASSTHGFDVSCVLALGEQLGLLPSRTVLFAVEAGACDPGTDLSPPVRSAIEELHDRIRLEISGFTKTDATSVRGENPLQYELALEPGSEHDE